MATSPPPHRASTSDSEFKQAMSGLKKSLVGNATGLRSLPWLQHGGERDVASTGKRNSTREWAFSGRSDQEEGGGQPWGDIDAGGHNTADTQVKGFMRSDACTCLYVRVGMCGIFVELVRIARAQRWRRAPHRVRTPNTA